MNMKNIIKKSNRHARRNSHKNTKKVVTRKENHLSLFTGNAWIGLLIFSLIYVIIIINV